MTLSLYITAAVMMTSHIYQRRDTLDTLFFTFSYYNSGREKGEGPGIKKGGGREGGKEGGREEKESQGIIKSRRLNPQNRLRI